jgi:hypothetical protein
MKECRRKVSPASAFLLVVRCLSPASAFRHQGSVRYRWSRIRPALPSHGYNMFAIILTCRALYIDRTAARGSFPTCRLQKKNTKNLKRGLKYIHHNVHCTYLGMYISDFVKISFLNMLQKYSILCLTSSTNCMNV